MSSMAQLPINFKLFLRPAVLEKVALAIKGAIIIAIFALLVFTVQELLSNGVSALIASLKSSTPSVTTPVDGQSAHLPRRGNYEEIAQRNIFGPLGQVAVQPTPKAEKPVSNVALTLLGTYVPADDAPFAIIEHSQKKLEDAFGISDSVFGEAKLVAVYSDRVEIERNGQIEILKLEDMPSKNSSFKDGVASTGADQFSIQEDELNKALENLPLLLTQARAVPYFKDGKAVGLRMFAIKSGSLFEKIGLQNGDILKSINGKSLADMGEAIKLFEKLKAEREISVALERNSESREFKYEIE